MSGDAPKRKLPSRDPAKVCGAGTPPCQQWKGFKTPHPGIGACSVHGGMTQTHNVKAEKQMATERMRTYGVPIDTDPKNALMGEVRRSAGIAAWLEHRVGQLTVDGSGEPLLEKTMFGSQPAVWIKLYKDERAHLARVCKMALDAGIDERLIKVAESQAQQLAQIIQAIFEDPRLGLSEAQQAIVPNVVREHLRAVA